ncbi:hypothetical protein PIROE2DRAFT_10555 [Piromyces sp. E2]|nr:hypothetical protein PIROE2DRAFT_10555 [Piromyces sp. E2]|eukprot:OUM63028.1 hypothetical protein PIROE2DRAFT_10555 [Piromyces sp. E2]
MGLIGKNQNNIDKGEPNTPNEESKKELESPSQYHEDFHENAYGDIDDLLGLDILETCYESPEENTNILKKDDSFYHDSDGNMNDKLMTINSFCSETSSLKQNMMMMDDSNCNSNISLGIARNRSYTRHRSHSFNRSHSSVKRSSSYTTSDTGQKLTIFTDDDYKFLQVIRDETEEGDSGVDSYMGNSTNTMNGSKNSVAFGNNNKNNNGNNNNNSNNNKNIELASPVSATIRNELDECKSNPELMNKNNDNSFTTNDYTSSSIRDYPHRKQRSNTLSSIYNTPKRSLLNMNKRSSFVEVRKQNGGYNPNEMISPLSPLSPLSGKGFNIDSSSSFKKLEDVTNDIDSILVLADEKENVENNNAALQSPKIKKLENKSSSNSTFFSHLKRRKDRKSMSSLSCITNTDILQRKKSFVYSADVITPTHYGSAVLPSVMTINHSFVAGTTTQNSNSQIMVNEELLHSPKILNTNKHNKEKNEKKDFYQLPDYSDLMIMSESDIDGIYNHMVNDCHKKKSKASLFRDKDKEKDLKDKEYATIIPLKSVEDKDDVQNNKDDPLRKSIKILNESFQMGSLYDVNTPKTDEKKLTFNMDDDNNVLVVINPYGIRDIDFSTRRVLPVTNKENCSEDVDDLFNIENDVKYKSTVNKLTEMETNYKQYKNNSEVKVKDPILPNDIDNLFILSSDLEKKMSVMDSLIVIDDIQENVRPDISDLLDISEKKGNNKAPPKLNKSVSSSSTPTSLVSSPKNIFRRISKSFSTSNNRLNSRVIENTPLNVENGNYKMEKILTPKNILVIPSYTELNKSNNELFDKNNNTQYQSNTDLKNSQMNNGSNANLLNNKNKSLSLSKSCFISNEDMGKNTSQSLDKINSPVAPRKSNANALNYLHSLSKSFSNDGLVVVRSNDSMIDENNNEEKLDYIYYNRDNDKRKMRRKASVMDEFIELSTVNNNTKKKFGNDSTVTFRTTNPTVKDYYDARDEGMGNPINMTIINTNNNAANYYRQRDRLIASTNINMIKNELYYNDYINNTNGSLTVNNLKANHGDLNILEYNNPNIINNYYAATMNPPNSLIEIEEDDESNDIASQNKKGKVHEIINEANQALENNSSSINNTINKNSDINYYFHITNIMNDSMKKYHENASLEIPQFTTGYNVSNNYISRMHLASSIDIFNRLEALNRSNSIHQIYNTPKPPSENKFNTITTAKLRRIFKKKSGL